MTATVQLGEATMVTALREARERTEHLVAGLEDDALERVHSTLMSPLVWDLGHIAAFEDLWLGHRYGERPLLRAELAEIYDAFETPRAARGELAFLRPPAARAYLAEVRERTLAVIEERGVGDGALCELVLRHEHQHTETMLQTMQLAGLRGFEPAPPPPGDSAEALTGLELLEVPEGPCWIGAAAEGFAYDNERPGHRVEVPGFQIGRSPVSNGAFGEWMRTGGYDRREWWSEAGWAFRARTGTSRPGGWSADHAAEVRLGAVVALDPARPVIHISCHEAEAFARAHGARLPTEVEWEKAARFDPAHGETLAAPWGEGPAVPGVHANLDQLAGGPNPTSRSLRGSSPVGCRAMIGDVWEWTASRFTRYPGFTAFPYREYSEVFFGAGHRVLRGGSWATRAHVASASFRNWDLPERRQIFAGVRLARDL